MAADKIKWTKVAESLAEIGLDDHPLAEVMAGEKKVCIGKYKDELFAIAATCPHAGGHFAEGFIDALGNVVCPLHRYKFCMKNGRNVSGEGYHLKHWPVKVDEEGVHVGLSSSGFLGLW